ncbi:DEAD/DEAH box helicase [Oceanirhabdus sp. W0125-5]|uniref:DEAD/DEAH box helicase n=1 Tax=Oceanirhabdus sp. W0125-5 TaxID=2999116 RepID=UPI0022F2BB40|nr:DEAD/DEAH box helicase [Oceanirhabdus sp. W0125-5]WBW97180.1 DEAD/DEAH box helicase [Oceanirhabdus sp. W0125-5]
MNKKRFTDFGLHNDILRALKDLEFKYATEVQEKVIPYILKDKDLIVRAQTGSGKTAAFGIPLCENVDANSRDPQVLILTPTRELAVQVKTDIGNIGRYMKIRCAAVYGKHPMRIEVGELKQRVHMISGTPGRVNAHIENGTIDVDKIKYLIIDEADEMLNMGFIDQVVNIINKLPKDRVTLLFSATMPEKIQEICKSYMSDPMRIEIQAEESTLEKINQVYYEIEENNKNGLLNRLIITQRPESCIIFCNTRETVRKVQRFLNKNKYFAEGLHGGMEQEIRLQTIKDFKKGKFHFLVATDVAARGIHIDDISLVINYDIPVENESYVHRIGRTGRAGKGGKAVTFVAERDQRMLERIEEYIELSIEKAEIPTELEVRESKETFPNMYRRKPKEKKDRAEKLNKKISRIRLNAGKNKKLRAGDIIGALCSINGITNDDIGIIDIQKTCTYIEIFEGKGDVVLKALEKITIKGKSISFKNVGHKY